MLLPHVSISNAYLLPHQGSDHLSADRGQRPGASLTGWEHLPHLLRGGPLSETRTIQEGADALGEE